MTRGQHRVLLAVLLLGCGGAPRNASAPPEPTTKVLDAGAEPRRALRYELAPHVPEQAEITFKTRLNGAYTNTVLETGHGSVDVPTIKSTARLEVTEVSADGTATVMSVVEDVAVLDDVVDPRLRKMVDLEAKAMKGVQSTWHMSSSGRVSDATASAPSASAATRTQLSNVGDTIREHSVVFPDEPVGTGATWQVTSRHAISGVTWSLTTTYRLKALTDAAATLAAQIAMHADSQPLSVEPSATTRLTSATSHITAELVVPLHGLVATGSAQATSEMNFLVVRGHLRLASSVQSEVISSVRPVAADARP